MNYLKAMKMTVDIAKEKPWWTNKAGCTVDYLERMYQTALDKNLSEVKLANMLGWMQAIVYCYSDKKLKVEDLIKINKWSKK